MISKKWLSMLAVLTMILVLASCGSSQGSSGDQGSSDRGSGDQGSPKPEMSQEAREERVAPKTVPEEETSSGDVAQTEATVPAPADSTLRLTVPEMSRVKNSAIPDALGTDEARLRTNTAIHLRGTGFPWQEEANVYIAGHRLGYPSTDSYLAFYDLNKLEKGDDIRLTDANGKKYTYEVFKKIVVDPTDVYVTEPIEGKNIVSLQACTLPDYSRRIVVQGELEA